MVGDAGSTMPSPVDVFTRRARLRRNALGLSTVGGQASLKTLVDEPDFALASFLLSVLVEGSCCRSCGFSGITHPIRSPNKSPSSRPKMKRDR